MITPGELHPGMMISIIDSAPVFTEEDPAWQESGAHESKGGNWISFSTFRLESSDSRTPGFGKVVLIKAVNLPLVIVQDIITKKHALHDCRKFIFREVDAAFVTLYVDAFTPVK